MNIRGIFVVNSEREILFAEHEVVSDVRLKSSVSMVKCCGYEARPSASASAVRNPEVAATYAKRAASLYCLYMFFKSWNATATLRVLSQSLRMP